MQLSMLLDHKTKAIMRRMLANEQTNLLDKEMYKPEQQILQALLRDLRVL